MKQRLALRRSDRAAPSRHCSGHGKAIEKVSDPRSLGSDLEKDDGELQVDYN